MTFRPCLSRALLGTLETGPSGSTCAPWTKTTLSLSIWVVFFSRMHYQDQLAHPEHEKTLSLSYWYHICHIRNAHSTVKHPFLVVSSSRIHTLIHSPDLLVLAAYGEVAGGLVLHDPGQVTQQRLDAAHYHLKNLLLPQNSCCQLSASRACDFTMLENWSTDKGLVIE